MIENYTYPNGLKLLSSWQWGDPKGRETMKEIFDAAIQGEFEENFSILAPNDEIHSTASVHMLALSILHDLYGVQSKEYYCTDPYRYVRANLTVGRLLGVKKLYMTWALYAFSCEAVGQKMMYPDKFPPGSDPDEPLINKENCFLLDTPDFTSGIPKIVDDILRVTEELTGMEPLLQISAPYSLAADIYGQEPLLADVVNDPEHVNKLLINSVSCVNAAAQFAGIAALDGPDDSIHEMMEKFTLRRKLIHEGLNSLPGVECSLPGGAFYAFPKVIGTGMNGSEFCKKAMHEAGVAIVPGTAFGKTCQDYVRFSFAASRDNISQALENIKKMLTK